MNIAKFKSFLDMLAIALAILFVITVAALGLPTAMGQVHYQLITVPAAEIRIVGKANAPGIRIRGSLPGAPLSADCRPGAQYLCAHYHHRALTTSQLILLRVNQRFTIIARARLRDDNGREVVIDNLPPGNPEPWVRQLVSDKQDYLRLFGYALLWILAARICLVLMVTLRRLRSGNH